LDPISVGSIQVETTESCADGSQKRALPTFASVNIKNLNNLDNLSNWRNGYTNAVAGNTVARAKFDSVLTGASTVYAYNPRKGQYEAKPVAVTADNTATAAFNFDMNCTRPTGATGAGG